MSTGSVETSKFQEKNNPLNGFETDENDTLDRTNTFPFDVLFDEYYDTSAEVYSDLLVIQNNYPEIVELYILTDIIPAGQTWQGNEIYGIKISDNVANEPDYYDDPDEETFFIVGNHHAREWMTVVTPMYFAYFLTHFYGMEPTDNDGDGLINEDIIDGIDNDGDGEIVPEDGFAWFDGIDNDGDGIIDEGIDEDPSEARITHLVDNREIWIVPLLNPDGYNYDREDPDRLWRKNMRDNTENDRYGDACDGVDINRNYPFEWGHNTQFTALIGDDLEPEFTVDDDNICSDVYHGPREQVDNDGDCELNCDIPFAGVGEQNTQTGVDEDPPDAQHTDDDGDGKIDEDKEGGFSEPETQVIEYLTWRLDIYEDYPQDKYLEDYQKGIIRTNWPEMFVTAPDGDYINNYRKEAHDMKHNIMNSVSYHSYSALYIWPWGYKDQDPPHELYMENQVKPLMNLTGYGNWKDQGGYKVSGDINDFLYGMQGSFSYTVELNYGQQGNLTGGFHADTLLIRPTVRMHLLTNMHFLDESPKARIGQMITSDYGDLGVGTINSPDETMMPKLTILSEKGDAVDIGFGSDTNIEFDEDRVYSNDDIAVKVKVDNAQYMLKDSLLVKYRTEKMPENIWNEVPMYCIEKCDLKDYSNYNNTGGIPVRNAIYKAYIPETEESMNVQFYAVAQDSRLANAFGGGFVFTGYGNAEPIEIFVDDIIGFGNAIVDFFAVAIMMGIMYGVVWGGLYKTVGIATEAERRKNEDDEILDKSPKKKAKPPVKPPNIKAKSIAAIPKEG
tara:strand:+ start:2104 stop:4458 length:2355 start_codon:yes stop_codon:yes gene_type:complete